MKRYYLICLLVILLFSCQKENIDPQLLYNFSKVDELLETQSEVFKNKVVVIVRKNGKTIYQKSAGNIDENALFPVASASKWTTVATLLALEDKGLIDLEHPVAHYLPFFSSHNKSSIKLSHTLSMSSGLEECNGLEDNCIIRNQKSLMDNVEAIAKNQKIIFTPGKKLNYGSVGMQLAGGVAEKVTGKPWNEIFREHIGKPCEMEKSQYLTGLKNIMNVGEGLFSTANEYLNFLEMIANEGTYKGTPVLQPNSANRFFHAYANQKEIVYSPFPPNPPFHPYQATHISYGLGCWIEVISPETGQVEQVSSPGAFGTYPWIDKKRNLTGIIFTLSELNKTLETEYEIIDLIRNEVDRVNFSLEKVEKLLK
jgi:CubicO group peptidase (beta-lactamase class C family)